MATDYPQHNGGADAPQMSDRPEGDLKEQVAQLRAQLQELIAQVAELMRDHVAPAAADVASRAEQAMHQAKDAARAKIEAITEDVRERPLAALLLVAGVGYIAGRVHR